MAVEFTASLVDAIRRICNRQNERGDIQVKPRYCRLFFLEYQTALSYQPLGSTLVDSWPVVLLSLWWVIPSFNRWQTVPRGVGHWGKYSQPGFVLWMVRRTSRIMGAWWEVGWQTICNSFLLLRPIESQRASHSRLDCVPASSLPRSLSPFVLLKTGVFERRKGAISTVTQSRRESKSNDLRRIIRSPSRLKLGQMSKTSVRFLNH